MAAGLTLDSGALIAAEKGARTFWALWKEALARGVTVTVPAAVVAQVWRGNDAVIARVLLGCEVEELTEERAKRVGRLLAASRTVDVVDASVAAGAVARGDAIVTSDRRDLERLAASLRRKIVILAV
ncbi:MAG TPA: PIN domain-containing protein [Polyangia bacterium]|nr:PIN domain-containing protein [Polyangia bacterium]